MKYAIYEARKIYEVRDEVDEMIRASLFYYLSGMMESTTVEIIIE